MNYIHAFHVEERGARHLKEDLPLQDASFSEISEITDENSKYTGKYAIAVVSDGHGSTQYFRSDRGAKFAYTAVRKAFVDFMKNAGSPNTLNNHNKLKNLIYQNWKELVFTNIQQDPFQEKELHTLEEKMLSVDSKEKEKLQYYLNKYRAGEMLHKAYGCTLIAVLFCEKYVLAVHIGDGTCVAFYPDGSCDQPVPADGKSMANQTSSLCGLNPEDCRVYVFEKKPIAVFLSSDGIDDSFGQGEGLYNFYRAICIKFAECGEAYSQTLQDSLHNISEKYSKDDISIAGIYNELELDMLKDVMIKILERGEKLKKIYELKDTQGGVSEYSLNTLKSNIEKLEIAVKQEKSEISTHTDSLTLLEQAVAMIRSDFVQKNIPAEETERQKLIEQYHIEISALDTEISALERKRAELKKLSKELTEASEEIFQKRNSIQKNQEDLKLQQEKLQKDEETLEKAVQKYEQLLKRKQDSEKEYSQLTNDVNLLDSEINAQLKHIEEERKKLAEPVPEEEISQIEELSEPEVSPEPVPEEEVPQTEELSEPEVSPEPVPEEETSSQKSSSMQEENLTPDKTVDELRADTFDIAEKFNLSNKESHEIDENEE